MTDHDSLQSEFTPLKPNAVAPARERVQSDVLTAMFTLILLSTALWLAFTSPQASAICMGLVLSFLFALAAWRLRAATPAAAALGGVICFLLSISQSRLVGLSEAEIAQTAKPLAPLIVLFVLTFGATRFGRLRKEHRQLAESRRGRRASQIAANLGMAGLCAAVGFYPGALAALAEATADTLSSEIGQALGGPTWLLTSFRRVAPGTDGGMSLSGTSAGALGGALVVLAGCTMLRSTSTAALVFLASAAGLLFDSLLGATLQQRGYLGNDLVNFSSTAFSAGLAAFSIHLGSLTRS